MTDRHRASGQPGTAGDETILLTPITPGNAAAEHVGDPSGNAPRRRRRWVIGVAVTAAVMSVGGTIASTMIKSPAQEAADTRAPKASVLTAPVVHRVLADTTVLRGTFVTGQQHPVLPTSVAATADGPGGGALVVTAIKVAAGQSVDQGEILAEVSGRPVFTLRGSVPAYRDMLPGESGADIAQLQRDLQGLGVPTGSDRSGYFGSGTKAAVARWYRHLGYTVPTTGDATVRAVQAARAAVQQQEETISNLNSEIAAATATPSSGTPTGRPSSGAATGATAGPTTVDTGSGTGSISAQLSHARATLTTDEQALADAEAKDGPEVPSSEILFLPSFPARVDSVSAHVGDHVANAMMELTAGGLSLTGHLLPSDAPLVKVGMRVTVLDESTGIQYPGHVGAIEAQVIPSAQSADTSPYIPVEITPSSPWDPSLDGKNVRITIVAAATTGEVLAVPAAAISTGVGGRTTVTVLTADGSRRNVAVTPGVTADNYVQVTPSEGALAAGDQVVVGG